MITSSVSVLVPYRPGDAHRVRTWEWVQAYVQHLLPKAEIVTADSGMEPFSYGDSINLAAAHASGDVFFIVDADCVHTSTFPALALEALAQGAAWCGTSEYVATTELGASALLCVSPETQISGMARKWGAIEDRFQSPAGCVMLPRSAFETVEGYDHRFKGWGWMDWAFFASLYALVGQRLAIPNTATVHLWHSRKPEEYGDNPHAKASRDLAWRYTEAAESPATMRALIAERNA